MLEPVFPAYAGVILTEFIRGVGSECLSRIRGGDPDVRAQKLVHVLSFPHTRG